MVNFLALVVLSLAAFRIGNILQWEHGPYHVFDTIRHLAGVRYDELNHPYGTNVISDMFLCFWCLSVWVALVLVSLYYIFGDVILAIYLPFAVSGFAILINKISDK